MTMPINELTDELRKRADDLARHASTNEMHQLASMTDLVYHLAMEVKRLSDINDYVASQRTAKPGRNH